MTVTELVQAMCSRLQAAGVVYGHGTTNAWDEAAWLVLWQLGLALDALDERADDTVTPAQQAKAEALVARRISTRLPAAYLTGEAWLQGVPFLVDERVIVPRSLIAEPLADGTLDVWLKPDTQRVLDLCTGCGSLAVLAALAWPEVVVDASDISADALAVARSNVDRHGLAHRITLHQGDGLAALDVAQRGAYDLILCNPPYVNRRAMAELPPEFLAEPALALDGNTEGGDDGMDFVRRLMAQAHSALNPGGVLVLEVGHEREHFETAFRRLSAVWLPTSAGDDQVLLITREALA
jgi:ribosomal protein L3 glutamine methyltransferase